MLDKDIIEQKMLPQLAEKFFGDGEFKVAVTDSAGAEVYSNGDVPAEKADASADIMTIFPVNVFLTRVVRGEPAEAKKSTTVYAERLETQTVRRSWTINNSEPDEVIKRGTTDIAMATGISVPDVSAWKVNVRHAAGSVDAFIRGERNRNLLIGFGIYLLLIGGLLAIVLSAMRAKRLAQRQLDFVSSVSHEFRTPLAVIYSAGENLADGVAADGKQVEKYGALIKGEGRKLSAMVEQILQFAGARSGRRKYNFASANISDLIGDAVNEVAPVIEENDVELRTDIPEGLPAVNADRAAFSQAVQNLILNAVKYGNGNRFVEISAARNGNSIDVNVKDRGIGISKSDMRHLFEPFFRARSVVDAQIHGNGLGLSLVKQIVEAHGGTIRAESEKGVGSTFTISIPRAES
jgi:signal transduction histidine kinase